MIKMILLDSGKRVSPDTILEFIYEAKNCKTPVEIYDLSYNKYGFTHKDVDYITELVKDVCNTLKFQLANK